MSIILKLIGAFYILFFAVGSAIANNKGISIYKFIYESRMNLDNQNVFKYICSFIYNISITFFVIYLISLLINILLYENKMKKNLKITV